MPWPAARGRTQGDTDTAAVDEANGAPTRNHNHKRSKTPPGKRFLSTWDLITLSVSMAGAQITWTVELGYGTPFLLSLGLTEELTSLVWLAGPISGLIAQPVIGALSDSSSSKYRRRFWIVLSTVALVLSTLALAFCKEIAGFVVDLAGVGSGDWSEKREERAKTVAIGLAVVSFYVLDFALNGLQASLRNLLLDITPPGQLSAGNAWHGRMTNAGNIIGFGFGFLPLASLPVIRLIGGGQFRKFCIICMVILVVTVWITCWRHEEEERPKVERQQGQGKFQDVIGGIRHAILHLPKPIRRVCYVQLFAFMGWFPFLFYATTYMGQVMAYELDREPDGEIATRTGEFAMLIYSVVAVIAGTILPPLAARDRRLMADNNDVDEDAEISRLRATVRQWRVDAARRGRPLHLPVMPFLLRNIWTGALLFFSLLMFTTFFISTVFQATIFISCVGICWAVAMWVPFTIVMELLREPPRPRRNDTNESRRPMLTRNLSTPVPRLAPGERQPLLRRRSLDEFEVNAEEDEIAAKPLPGGTVLGIHNLSIVVPQLIIAIVTSIIFRLVDGKSPQMFGEDETKYYGKHGVAWVLRFGGFCAFIGALAARRVPPTPTEKAMRRRLGEMKLLGEEGSP